MTSHARRAALAQEQRPFCVPVGCPDSRVPPEVLFGRGPGELFIVRNAGNVVDLAASPAVERNVLRVVARIRHTGQLLTGPQNAGRLKIMGACYDLDDGSVEFYE